MGQVGVKMRRVGPLEGYYVGGLAHYCPGCDRVHVFALDGKNSSGGQWTWDGNVDAPTFAPSMHIKTNPPDDPDYQPGAISSVCHYFLQGGRIQFLGDCTHALRNQTVPLPDLPLYLTDAYLVAPRRLSQGEGEAIVRQAQQVREESARVAWRGPEWMRT